MQRLVTGLSALSQPTAGPIRARCDSAAAALAHEPRGVRTPRESAPCPRELALRARERDTSPLPRLPTPSVCSAVRASLCERDEHKGGTNVRLARVSLTVPTETTRTTRYTPALQTNAPLRVTLPVQLTFCPVSSLSSQPRACRSSTMRVFSRSIGMSHAAERPVEVRSRCAITRTRALAPPAPPESRFPTRDLAPLFPIARALSVSLDTAQLPSLPQRTVPCRYKHRRSGRST